MIEVARFDPESLERYEAYGGRYTTWEDVKFDAPNVIAAFAEKRVEGDLSQPWLFWNDEVWYMIEGALQLEWREPPMFNDLYNVTVRSGDMVLMPMGTHVKASVLEGGPARFLWVSMPRPRHFGSEGFWNDRD